jgi:CobQ/CobB/MinD/ParA nucleotide binding domain
MQAENEPTYLAFVSYKGGVGRSLAAVSCANLLARGGSHVLLIDFDVEAPSLPGFYGVDSFVGLRHDNAEAKGLNVGEGTGLVAWTVDRKMQGTRCVPTRPFAKHVIPFPVQGEGSLRLLPAGAVAEEMLQQLAHFRWQAWMRPRETEWPWAQQMAKELRESIAKLAPRPEFVLVDATAGLDAPAYRVLEDLADKAFFLVTDEPGEPVVFQRLNSNYPDRMHLVSSRLSKSWLEARRTVEKSDLRSEYEGPISILRHDPLFSGVRRASVPLNGDFEDTLKESSGETSWESKQPYQLTLDHIRMLSAGLGQEVLKMHIKDPQVSSWVDKALKEEAEPEDYYKIFALFDGTIFNPSDPDKARNVSFRVETIRRIFNDVWSRLGPRGNRNEAFTDAGAEAGFTYGQALRKEMLTRQDTIANFLRRWCYEDSQVGFGQLLLSSYLDDKTSSSGTIHVEKAFLHPEQKGPKDEILKGGSSILEGYLRGVLRGLFDDHQGDRVQVEVNWKTGDVKSETGESAVVTFRAVYFDTTNI